jgi:hypothetical protein
MDMRPATWTKQPSIKRRLPFDLSTSMITGDTIASYEAKIFDAAGDDLSATMIAGSTNTTTIVYAWVQGGTSGMVYFLRIKITTTMGEIIEDDLAVVVRELHK